MKLNNISNHHMPISIILVTSFLLLTSLYSGFVTPSGQTGNPLFPTPVARKDAPKGQYCLTKEELEQIKNSPIAFTCDRTNIDRTQVIESNVPYVLAAEDVEVKKIFIHPEKQLILKETCAGVNYYTWKCHPPSYGSIYTNTLWKLRDTDSNRTPLKDGDHFDVYLRKDASDTERFVCKDQGGANVAVLDQPVANIFADSPLKGEIINIQNKRAVWYYRSDAQKTDIEDAPLRKKIGEISIKAVDYDVFVSMLKAFSPDEDKNYYLVEKGVLPEGNDNLPDIITYDIFSITKEYKPKGFSLQLGTFNPIPPTKRWLEIYLPESKPVIYLYPEKPIRLTVKINPQNGYITQSDPPYDKGKGWEIFASPDGTLALTDKKSNKIVNFPYLYYESEVKGYKIPQEGFILPKTGLSDFFAKILPSLGLNEKETNDFSSYWLSRLLPLRQSLFFITFIPQEQINKIDPIIVVGDLPDTLIRLRIYIKPLEKALTPPFQMIPVPPIRTGFTIVEWGGILDER